MGALVTESPFT